jgi:hypothetical protein
LWLSIDGAASFQPLTQTAAGMLGFAVSPNGDQIAFGGPQDGLYLAPADASAEPTKVSNLRVSCLRWNTSGMYVCAGEPTDPYSLGYASDPMQGFVPMWQRANTCQEACPAPSTLERMCTEPWQMIAQFVGAHSAVCGESASPLDAGGIGAGMSRLDAGNLRDAGHNTVADASKTAAAARPAAASGCTVLSRPGVSAPGCLAAILVLGGWAHRRRATRGSDKL